MVTTQVEKEPEPKDSAIFPAHWNKFISIMKPTWEHQFKDAIQYIGYFFTDNKPLLVASYT